MSKRRRPKRAPGRPRYADAVEAAALAAGVIKPGTVTMVQLWHDPGCPRPQGGRCRCNPEVRIVGGPGRG
jgi:hypothetical protein